MATAAADGAELAVFPVGHYIGAFHPEPGAPAEHHALRIGRLAVNLDPDRGLPVWAAAHRPTDAPDRLWTRRDVADLARTDLGVDDPRPVMAELFDTGVLVEVTLGTADAIGFAEHHRVPPLMHGLGNTVEHPLACGIGLVGAPPVVEVPTVVFDVLQWGSAGRNLWGVCQAVAATAVRAGGSDPGECDPVVVLDTFLRSLQTLLGPNAAYVDEARQS